MLTLSSLAGYVVSFLVKLALGYLQDRRAEQAQRDLGAARQAQQSTLVAEAQEARARAAGAAAEDGPDDPRDILPEHTP